MFYLTNETPTKKSDAQLRDLFAQAMRYQAAAPCRTEFNSASCALRMIGNELVRRAVAPR